MENSSSSPNKLTWLKLNPELETINQFSANVVASILVSEDIEATADELNKDSHRYLSTRHIKTPADINQSTLNFRWCLSLKFSFCNCRVSQLLVQEQARQYLQYSKVYH